MSEDKGQAEIVASSTPEQPRKVSSAPKKRKPRGKPKGWDPFHLAPDAVKKRYKRRLAKCHSSMPTAIELTCIECMGYSTIEAKRCDAHYCPLFPYNRKIFKVEEEKDETCSE
jgi:hypothetical protein